MPRKNIILLAIVSLLLVSPVRLRTWRISDSDLRSVPLPPDLRPVSMQEQADLDTDGIPEQLVLQDGNLQIRSAGKILWTSPDTWEVQQALIADLNQDLRPEAVLLVSRPFQPWPVDAWLPSGGRIDDFHDSQGQSSHIILIGWRRSKFGELWAGSAMAELVTSMAVTNPGNGTAHLVTLEKQYGDPPAAPARQLKVWDWNGFGFSLVSSVYGPFTHLVVGQSSRGEILVLEQ